MTKITRAMEMVSASKMRRAQRNVLATRPYAERLLDVMGELTERASGARTGTLLEVRPKIDAVFAANDYANFNFNYTPLVVVALFFVALTVPMARFTDWLGRRYSERAFAGAVR